MTPSAPDPSWPPASAPQQAASSLVASLQYLTSSARLLLAGCFQCRALGGGCWRRQEERDGAWFDCEKLQVEHPHCYVNPVALCDPVVPPADHAALQVVGQPTTVQQPRALPAVSGPPPPQLPPPDDRRHTRATHSTDLAGRPDTQKLAVIQTGGVTMPPCKQRPRQPVLMNGGWTTTAVQRGDEDDGDHYTHIHVRVPIGSFADKLEADLRRLEYDRQRAEGEVAHEGSAQQHLQCVDADVFSDVIADAPFQPEDETQRNTDVWKASELESVFECYNMAAFYSYGAPVPITEKFSSKTRGEKYEEVFPASRHNNNNNNNTIKVFCPPAPPNHPEDGRENDPQNFRNISENSLNNIIRTCIFSETLEQFNEAYEPNNIAKKYCDGEHLCYGDKKYTMLLIFDLVKSVMSECETGYSHVLSLCDDYPVDLVQSRVVRIMQDSDQQGKINPSGLQVFTNSLLLGPAHTSANFSQLVSKRLVDQAVASQVRTEDRLWQQFGEEECEVKKAVAAELLDDLVGDTARWLGPLVTNKLTNRPSC